MFESLNHDERETYLHSFFDSEMEAANRSEERKWSNPTEDQVVWAVINAFISFGESVQKAEWEEGQRYYKALRAFHYADRRASNAKLEAKGGKDKNWVPFSPVSWVCND
jgi:hypothetical protein